MVVTDLAVRGTLEEKALELIDFEMAPRELRGEARGELVHDQHKLRLAELTRLELGVAM